MEYKVLKVAQMMENWWGKTSSTFSKDGVVFHGFLGRLVESEWKYFEYFNFDIFDC